jgi:hypothetical protein
MRRNDDELVLAQLVDEAAHFMFLIRIEPIRGFVQDQRLGIVDEGLSQSHAAPKAFGESLDDLVDDGRQREPVDHHVAPLTASGTGQAADIGDEVEKLCDRHLAIAGCAFRQIAHTRFGGDRLAFDVVSTD